MALEGTTEALAVQTLVANYNRISTGLAETPETWRSSFARRNDGSFDPFHWSTAFLLATNFAPRLWRPVLHCHAATGDIIAPIRDTTGVNSRLDDAASPPLQRRPCHPLVLYAQASQSGPHLNPASVKARKAVRCS